jgi:hypothetical protein
MAEPAFGALGFTVVRREQVTIGAEVFDRCEMEKSIGAADADTAPAGLTEPDSLG